MTEFEKINSQGGKPVGDPPIMFYLKLASEHELQDVLGRIRIELAQREHREWSDDVATGKELLIHGRDVNAHKSIGFPTDE